MQERNWRETGLKRSITDVSSTVSNQLWRSKGRCTLWNDQRFTSLQHKGWTNVQIAEFTGHHRDTIARVLREDVEKALKALQRIRAVAVYDAQITES